MFMKEITRHFLQHGILELKTQNPQELADNPQAIIVHGIRALCDSDTRFRLSYYLDMLVKEKYGQQPSCLIALDEQAFSWLVLLCQKGSEFCETDLGYAPISDFGQNSKQKPTITGLSPNHSKVLLLTTAIFDEKNVIRIAEFLQEKKIEVLGVVTLFSFKNSLLKRKKIECTALSSVSEVIEELNTSMTN